MTGTERKVFQKYYPPDFDPAKIPRAKGVRNRQFVQRVMAPCNMQCNTCAEYIYKGKKFNMKRETAEGEFYLGLRIFRFYFKCPNCLAEISFKTDLENCDYQMEHGATRLFEAFKLYQAEQKRAEAQEEEDAKDPMKMLEKRTKASRAEMEAMGKLEEIQEQNRQHEAVNVHAFLEHFEEERRLSLAERIKRQEERDEEDIRQMFGREEDGMIRRRIKDEDEEEVDEKPSSSNLASLKWEVGTTGDAKPDVKKGEGGGGQKRKDNQKALLGQFVVVKKAKKPSEVSIKQEIHDHEDGGCAETSSSSSAITEARVNEAGKSPPIFNSESTVQREKATNVRAPPPAASSTPKVSGGLLGLGDYGSSSGSDSE